VTLTHIAQLDGVAGIRKMYFEAVGWAIGSLKQIHVRSSVMGRGVAGGGLVFAGIHVI
jgi:hypothetical protein